MYFANLSLGIGELCVTKCRDAVTVWSCHRDFGRRLPVGRGAVEAVADALKILRCATRRGACAFHVANRNVGMRVRVPRSGQM